MNATRYRDRIDDLYAVLDEAERSLNPLPEELRTVIALRLAERSRGARTRLSGLRSADCDEPDWCCLSTASDVVGQLAAEYVEIAHGGLARASGPYGPVCTVADRLVAEIIRRLPLPAWQVLCVPGTADQVSRTTRIIHLGLGISANERAVWALPLVVHELGHVTGPLMVLEAGTRSVPEVTAFLRSAMQRDRVLGQRLSELFADCFAAWVLGPAYGLATAWRGFGPGPADSLEATDTHPAPATRVREVARTLATDPALADAAERVLGLAPEHAADPADDLGADVVEGCERIRELLQRHLAVARYDTWYRSLGLVDGLTTERASTTHRPPAGVADLINAAWWARLHHPDLRDRIAARTWAQLTAQPGGVHRDHA